MSNDNGLSIFVSGDDKASLEGEQGAIRIADAVFPDLCGKIKAYTELRESVKAAEREVIDSRSVVEKTLLLLREVPIDYTPRGEAACPIELFG